MPSHARISATGEVLVFEPVDTLPAGFEPVATDSVDAVVTRIFPDATYFRNAEEDLYAVVDPSGSAYVERPVPDAYVFPLLGRPFSVDPNLPPVLVELSFARRPPREIVEARRIDPYDEKAIRIRRLVAALGGGPRSRFSFLRRKDGLLSAVLSLGRGALYASERFAVEKEGISRSELARALGVNPSSITRALERIGIPPSRIGPRRLLDRKTVEKVVGLLRKANPSPSSSSPFSDTEETKRRADK